MTRRFTFTAKQTPSNEGLDVILGGHTVKAFVVAPKEFQVMGIVRIGLEYGLLAKADSGNYVRVNGSSVQDLDSRKVDAAMDRARRTGRGESYAATRSLGVLSQKPRCQTTVIVRKHRKIENRDTVHAYLQSIAA